MDPVTIAAVATRSAVAIANAAGMGDWLKQKFAGRPGAQAASKIIDLAAAATGGGTAEEVVERLRNDAQAREDAKRLLLHWEQELVRLQYEDLASARAMYSGAKNDMADKLANRIMSWNLPAIVALVAGNCAVVYTIDNPTIAVALGNIIGASITYLWAERSQVVGFFFGSSIGSKDKSAMLQGRGA
jgi:hypothetical protein